MSLPPRPLDEKEKKRETPTLADGRPGSDAGAIPPLPTSRRASKNVVVMVPPAATSPSSSSPVSPASPNPTTGASKVTAPGGSAERPSRLRALAVAGCIAGAVVMVLSVGVVFARRAHATNAASPPVASGIVQEAAQLPAPPAELLAQRERWRAQQTGSAAVGEKPRWGTPQARREAMMELQRRIERSREQSKDKR